MKKSVIGIVVIALLFLFLVKNCIPQYRVETKTLCDTITICKIDTLYLIDTLYISKPTKDTVYIPTNGKDTIEIPIEQKLYSQEGLYDILISGYNAKIEDLKIYVPNSTTYITKETTETIKTRSRYSFYAGIGLNAFQGDLIPQVNVSIASPKKVQYGANIGYYNKDYFYGLNLQYKFF